MKLDTYTLFNKFNNEERSPEFKSVVEAVAWANENLIYCWEKIYQLTYTQELKAGNG